jgi:hypothetical protein
MDRALPVRAGAGPEIREIGPLLSGLHAAPVGTTKVVFRSLEKCTMQKKDFSSHQTCDTCMEY